MSRFVMPLVIGCLGTAILIALGVWQLERLEWKAAVLAEISERMIETPGALPAQPDEQADRFRPVTVSGNLIDDRTFVFASLKDYGVGFRVIQPLETDDGRRIMVELGVVRPDDFDRIALQGPVVISGLLHWPDETDLFTPEVEQGGAVRYSRDLASMAAFLATERVLIVTNQMTPADPLIEPRPLDPSGIANDHFEYALTWFGLAIVWVAMTILWIVRIARHRRFKE